MIRLDEIKDPKLRARILRTLNDADQLKHELKAVCIKPKRMRQDTNPLMNKLEQEYYEKLKLEHPDCAPYLRPQAIRFRLANGLWFKPDVTCTWGCACRAWEVKGPHAFRGGFENLKMAASTYPDWIWKLVWKENGVWQEQVVLS